MNLHPETTKADAAEAAPALSGDAKTSRLGDDLVHFRGQVFLALESDLRESDTSGLVDHLVELVHELLEGRGMDLAVVEEAERSAWCNPQDTMPLLTVFISSATAEECSFALKETGQQALLKRSNDSVVEIKGDRGVPEAINDLRHKSSPSVGAPRSAVCDNPNPTDGETLSGAVASSPAAAAPVITSPVENR